MPQAAAGIPAAAFAHDGWQVCVSSDHFQYASIERKRLDFSNKKTIIHYVTQMVYVFHVARFVFLLH